MANLGKTRINIRKILTQLVARWWFHNTTGFMFVDFVSYSVHSNLYQNFSHEAAKTGSGSSSARYNCGKYAHVLVEQ